MSLPTCLTLRTVKGSTLSWAELDNNFICLNNLISAKAGTGGNRWYIPSGETVSVTSDYQYFFYGDILIEGTLDLAPNSQLVVLNGDILMSGGSITGTGSIYDIDLPTFDTKVTGMTYSGDVLTLYQNDGTSFSATVVTSTDITITGGTYDPNTGVATFYNNVGGNFPVSGFLTGYTDINVSSLDYVGNTLVLNQTNGTSFSANTPMFSGNTSGDCISDLFVSNVNSCSPLHIQNISSGDVLIGENGGVNVGIGTSTPTSKLDIDLGSTSGTDVAIQTRGAIPFLANNRTFFSVNNNGRLTAGNIGGSSNLGHTFAAPIGSSNALKVTSDGSYQGLFSINTDGSFDIGNSVIAGGYLDSNGTNTFRFYGANGGQSQKVGINEVTPTASLHIKSSDSSNSNYGLKVQNSGGTDNLVVRNDGNVGIGTSTPSSKLHLLGNNSANGSYIRATQRTIGLGTISASQNLSDPIYSGYTKIDGVGTYFSNDLTYGESITSSGFTLGIYQIISNTLLYTTLNTGATFSNQPYTLQGNSRFEVGNNYFNVGNGNLVAYDNGSSIFIGTSALSTNRYRALSFGAENGTFVYCDIANNNVQIPKRVYINGTSAGNTSYLSVGGDGTFSTKYIGLQSNGANGSTMFVIGQQDSNYNTTMRFSHRPEQYGYYYYAYGVSQNNASSIGIGTDPTSTHRLTVNDGLKLLSTPFNETILDVKQATSVSIDSSMASSPLINAYSANTIYGLRTVLNGTNIATNLNVGETITASGVTLTVSEKVDNNTLYTTYNSLAQFTGYSYILQGFSRFNVLNNGNVGIGTSTPDSKLVIKGSDSSSSNYGLKVQNSGGTDNLVVRNDGNVGIGSSTPSEALNIYKSGFTQANLLIESDSNTSNITLHSFKNSQGTSGGSTINFKSLGLTYGNISTNSANSRFIVNSSNGFDLFLTNANSAIAVSNQTVRLITNNENRLTVLNNGDIGIGTITPTAKLTISGNTSSSSDIFNIANSQYPGIGTKIDGLGNLTIEGPTGTGYSQIVIKNSAGNLSNLKIDSSNVGSSIDLTRGNNNRYSIFTNNVDLVDETLYVPFRTFLDSSHRILSRTGNTEVIFLDATVNNSKVGIGTITPTSKLDISGSTGYNQLRLRATYTPTSSSDTNGNVGDIAWDDTYFYWKTSTQWLRISGQTF